LLAAPKGNHKGLPIGMRVKQREPLCTPFLLPPPAAKEKKGSIWGHPKSRQGPSPLDPRLALVALGMGDIFERY